MSSDSAPFAEGNFDPVLALEMEDKFSTADALDIEADSSEPPEEIWGGLRLAPWRERHDVVDDEVGGGGGTCAKKPEAEKKRILVHVHIPHVSITR